MILFSQNCHPDDRKDLFNAFLDASTSLSMTFERWGNIHIINPQYCQRKPRNKKSGSRRAAFANFIFKS